MGTLLWELAELWEHRKMCMVGTYILFSLYKCSEKKFLPSINGSKNAFSSKFFSAIQENVFFCDSIQGFCDKTTPAPIFTLQNNS